MNTKFFAFSAFAVALLIGGSVSMPANAQSAVDLQKIRIAPAATGSNGVVDVPNQQTATGTAICFTCGGDWPVFVGSFNVVSATNNVTERGSSCGGGLPIARTDTRPFICGR